MYLYNYLNNLRLYELALQLLYWFASFTSSLFLHLAFDKKKNIYIYRSFFPSIALCLCPRCQTIDRKAEKPAFFWIKC